MIFSRKEPEPPAPTYTDGVRDALSIVLRHPDPEDGREHSAFTHLRRKIAEEIRQELLDPRAASDG